MRHHILRIGLCIGVFVFGADAILASQLPAREGSTSVVEVDRSGATRARGGAGLADSIGRQVAAACPTGKGNLNTWGPVTCTASSCSAPVVWTAPADAPRGTVYEMVASYPTGGYCAWDGTERVVGTTTGTSLTMTGIPLNHTYSVYVRVQGCTDLLGGFSGAGDTFLTPTLNPTLSGAATGSNVTLSFVAPDDLTFYRYPQRSTDGVTFQDLPITNWQYYCPVGTHASYTDAGLAPGTYWYRIWTLPNYSGGGGYSNVVQLVVGTCTPLPAPTVSTVPSATPNQAGLTASVTYHGGSTYSWTVTNGLLTSGQGTAAITFTAGSSGNVGVSVVETAGSCSSPPGVATVPISGACVGKVSSLTETPLTRSGQQIKGLDMWTTPSGKRRILASGINGVEVVDPDAGRVTAVLPQETWQAQGNGQGIVFTASSTSGVCAFNVGDSTGTLSPLVCLRGTATPNSRSYSLALPGSGSDVITGNGTTLQWLRFDRASSQLDDVADAYSLSPIFGVATSGTTVAVASSGYGLELFTLSGLGSQGPYEIVPRGAISLIGSPYDVEICGSNAWVAGYWGGLLKVDISNLDSPRLLGTFSFAPPYVFDVACNSNFLAVASGSDSTGAMGAVKLFKRADADNSAGTLPAPVWSQSFDYATSIALTDNLMGIGREPSPVSAWSLGSCSLPQLWLVPGAVWSSGQGGAEWQTDVAVFNPSATSAVQVQVAFLDGSAPIFTLSDLNGKWKPVSVAPQATVAFSNVLSALFGLAKGNFGALLVRVDGTAASQPVVSGMTYDVSRGVGGTVGLSLPAAPLPSGAGAGIQAAGDVMELIGLRDTATNHTNFALANLYSDYVTAEVGFFGPDGRQLGQAVTMFLNPFGVQQLSNALSQSPPGGAGYDKGSNPVDSYRARVRLISGTAVLPYASVIDDVSKDPVLVTGTKSPVASYRIPGVVRTAGKAGTLWRSDLVIYNPSTSARSVRVGYSWLDAGGTNRTSAASIPFAAGQIVQWVDFVRVWLGLAEGDSDPYVSSFVDVSPADANADPLLVTARTYNNQPTGNVGLSVPGYTGADAASGSGAVKRLAFAGLRSDSNFRSNVALFLASGPNVNNGGASVKVYDANGTFLTSTSIGLTPASPFIQVSIDSLIAASPGNTSALAVVVENLVGSPISGYATVVDNRSGDGSLVPATPLP